MLRTAALAAALAAALMPAAAHAVTLPKLPTLPKPPAAAKPAACPGADAAPTSGAATRKTVLCLINLTRAAHGAGPLKLNTRLTRAARRHSGDMVRRHYFSHTSKGGATMSSRILRTRYVSRAQAYALGENIAWGAGEAATPAQIMKSWMASAGHKQNLLDRGYREIGIGVVRGTPERGLTNGATYTTDFGVRR